MKIISGNSNSPLANAICDHLDVPLVDTEVSTFSDGEIGVNIKENIRGQDVFIVQSTSRPVNDNLMELLIIIDAARRSSAKRITAVIPYFGYARQDARSATRSPITAKLVSEIISKAGAHRVLSIDLHSRQMQGFFDIPCDNLFAMPLFVADIKKQFQNQKTMIVSPDVGGVIRARALAKRLECPLAIIDKRREKANVSEVMNIVGNVDGYECILVDDMVDTAGTVCNAAKALMDNGATDVHCYATHGVLSGPAFERIDATNSLSSVVITDSILHQELPEKFRMVSTSKLFSQAIRRIHDENSVSELFK